MDQQIKQQEVYETAGEDKDFDMINMLTIQDKSISNMVNHNIITQPVRIKEVLLKYQRQQQNQQTFEQISKQVNFENGTPFEKITKLKEQIQQVNKDLNDLKEIDDKKDIQEYLDDIQQIQNDLNQVQEKHQLHKYYFFKNPQMNNYTIMNYDLQKHLTNQIINNLNQKEEENSISDTDNVKYQIYLNNQVEDLQRQIKLSEIEKKIQYYENFIGTHKEEKSLIQKINNLEKNNLQFGLINREEIQQMIIFINVRAQNQEQINNSISQDEQVQLQINDLYEQVQQTKETSKDINNIVDRLECLQTIHEQSSSVLNQINETNSIHEKMLKQLNQNQQYLKTLIANSKNNFEIINNNFEKLNKRIK